VNLANLSILELAYQLHQGGVFFSSGPFIIHVQSDLTDLAAPFHQLYIHYPLVNDNTFADIQVRLKKRTGIRGRWKSEAQLWLHDYSPFTSFPRDTGLPFLEWGINWCVATRAHQYLMLHAGVMEKNNQALLLPALPGSGKSTLCAALSQRDWRLLSDEFALVRPVDLAIVPFPRPISLKNESIAVIRAFSPDAIVGPEFPKTHKGTVAHLRPPVASVERAGEMVQAGWVVFPGFRAGTVPRLTPLDKTQAFIKLSHHSFNYDRIGLRGFKAVGGLIESCDCYSFEYGDLEQAVAQLDALVTGRM
jgi:HprK-related kinase A